jgi:hypothetical protein
MDQNTKTKDEMAYYEEVDKIGVSEQSRGHLRKPAGLAALSDLEYDRLGK